jgi:hypothetical protein
LPRRQRRRRLGRRKSRGVGGEEHAGEKEPDLGEMEDEEWRQSPRRQQRVDRRASPVGSFFFE